MKKIMSSFVLIWFVVVVQGQTVNGLPMDDIDVRYMEVIGVDKPMSNKVTVKIDFGQNTKFFSQNLKVMQVKDEWGKKVVFNSVVDALNFMDRYGWEFLAVYSVEVGGGVKESHYVMKKVS